MQQRTGSVGVGRWDVSSEPSLFTRRPGDGCTGGALSTVQCSPWSRCVCGRADSDDNKWWWCRWWCDRYVVGMLLHW